MTLLKQFFHFDFLNFFPDLIPDDSATEAEHRVGSRWQIFDWTSLVNFIIKFIGLRCPSGHVPCFGQFLPELCFVLLAWVIQIHDALGLEHWNLVDGSARQEKRVSPSLYFRELFLKICLKFVACFFADFLEVLFLRLNGFVVVWTLAMRQLIFGTTCWLDWQLYFPGHGTVGPLCFAHGGRRVQSVWGKISLAIR